MTASATEAMLSNSTLDLAKLSVREVNQALQDAESGSFEILNPNGAHALACGLDTPVDLTIDGHTGYYCAGMNKQATVAIRGNAGTGLAENMMSGQVRITGNASQSAGASGHGGLLIIEGNAAARCGISMKGIDIVVGGNAGHMSAFMAQAGNLVILGNAGADLGDSIYEANLYVRGKVESLGADCIEKEMRPEHIELLIDLLGRARLTAEPGDFTRYGSARQLYNFEIDNAGTL